MNHLALVVVGLAISGVLYAVAGAEENGGATTEIPLDKVLAADMPGTQSVRRLEPQREYTHLPSSDELIRDSVIARVSHALSQRPVEGERAGPAFVVPGTGYEALKLAAEVLTGKAVFPETVPAGTDLTLVFYSYRCGQYVWLDSVEQVGSRIVVRYRFASHRTRESTTHFALIPLGQLRKGTFQIVIEQLPPTAVHGPDRISPIQHPEQIVCESSIFHVTE